MSPDRVVEVESEQCGGLAIYVRLNTHFLSALYIIIENPAILTIKPDRGRQMALGLPQHTSYHSVHSHLKDMSGI